MSEGDVSLIRDEDVLRRMWQQTEDFSRKKEIRAHMYRLREERLRSLYSPEPGIDAKGCEFSAQGHVKSFADQNFQSMKSKEVRDASSPTKEFAYRGQDLKDLSNAGWNVESENRTTDDGRTHVKSVHANIEGRYDVDGGQGQFAAVDYNKQATTDYDDGKTSLKRKENVANTAAHEQVVRKTKDGVQSSSTTSSSTSTSKFEQVSSTREAVPYETSDDYDVTSQKSYNTNREDEISTQKLTKQTNEQNLRSDFNQGELVSRKVDYPDENTKVIVETRCLPDGTRVTSTRREFRAPAVQTSRSEQHSHQTRIENKSYESSQKRFNETSSKVIRESTDDRHNIVDSQKIIDDNDFKRNQIYSENKDEYKRNIDKYKNRRDTQSTVGDYDYRSKDYLVNKNEKTDQYSKHRKHETNVEEVTRREVITKKDDENNRRTTDEENIRRKNDDFINRQTNDDGNIRRRNDDEDVRRRYDDENIRHHKEQYRDRTVDTRTTVDDYDYRNKNNFVKKNDDNEKINEFNKKQNFETNVEKITRHEFSTTKKDEEIKRTTDEENIRRNNDDFTNRQTIDDGNIRRRNDDESVRRRYDDENIRHRNDKDDENVRSRYNNEKITLRNDDETISERVQETHLQKNIDERVHNVTRENVVVEKKISTDQYQSTYQTDYIQRKISNDLSPAHQAWASTLRSDTPTRPSTRASSPGSKTFKSSNSSLRSSVSPEKTYRKPSSRGESPDKIYRKPISRGGSPDKTYKKPSDRGESPNRTFGKPLDRDESPDKTYRKPSERGVSPDKTYRKPSDWVESPDKTYRKPADRGESPDKTYIKPAVRGVSPDKTYRKPLNRGESPDKTFRKPADRGESPDKTYRKPADRGVSPDKPYRKPSDQGESPDNTYKKPTDRSESPDKTYRKPSDRGESPDKTFRKPADRGESPDKTYRKPADRGVSPDKTYRNPSDRDESPDNTYKKPADCSESPDKTYRQPADRGESPDKTYRKTVDRSESPDKTYIKPADRGVSPDKTYRKPSDWAESPDNTYKKPADCSESPDKTYRKPADRGESPDKTYRKPADRGESPDKTYIKPADRGVSPDKTYTKPSDRGESPDKTYKKPAYRGDSPDKTYRKPADHVESPAKTSRKPVNTDASPSKSQTTPLSRDESPSKIDRHSPSRTYSDKYSSTQSITSITDTVINKCTRPEPHPDDSRQPKLGTSTEKPSDSNVTSNEKPENKHDRPRSPSKNSEKLTSPQRCNSSPLNGRASDMYNLCSTSPTKVYPDRAKPSDEPQTVFEPKDKYPEPLSPTRSATEPLQSYPNDSSPIDINKEPKEITPGYMKPTASSKPKANEDTKVPDRASPTKQISSKSPEGRPSKTLINKASDEHYKFIDEETKMYIRNKNELIDIIQKETTDVISTDDIYETTESRQLISETSPSPDNLNERKQIPTSPVQKKSKDDSPVIDKDQASQRPCPQKTPTSFRNKSPMKSPVKDDQPALTDNKTVKPNKQIPDSYDREKSPTKSFLEKRGSIIRSVDDNDDTVPKTTQTPRQKFSPEKIGRAPSPTKYGTYDIKRNSTSPIKPLSKDDKYKQTTDFISLEKTTEEINKTIKKERPRQLLTPSTSPTRKPKDLEQAPSSGQSSPTTSASGFVYYSSPFADKTIVTDLDEPDLNTEPKKDETNELPSKDSVKDKPSSKLPCRSPSPEKRPTKETLPRKSSLKKSSITQISPTEKPPTSFVISPNVETKEFTEHKVQIIDHPDKEKNKPAKVKPPFERRETYEERCRKILGMIDIDTNEAETKKTTSITKTLESNVSSPSVSPCRSPSPGKDLLHQDISKKTSEITKTKKFISEEMENINKTTISLSNITDTSNKTKSPSRDASPTKLQDIISPYDDKLTTKPDMKSDDSPITSAANQFPRQKDTETQYIRKGSPEKQTEQKQETNDKPSVISPKSHRSPSPTKQPKKPDVTVTKSEIHSEIQYASENLRDHKAFSKDVIEIIEDETDFAATEPTPAKQTRKIPIGKTSPLKKTNAKAYNNVTSSSKSSEYNTELIISGKETEILDRVQTSLRKLSPDRSEKTPVRREPEKEKGPLKSTSLPTENSETITSQTTITKESSFENDDITQVDKQNRDKVKDHKMASRPPSRNVSPTKKVTNVSPTPTRSISPKKPQSPTERPQSPQVPKSSGIKPREQIPSNIRKPSPTGSSTQKVDKMADIKKANTTTKQSSFTKISANKILSNKISQGIVNKVEHEPKKTVAPKLPKDYVKKDVEIKVTRTASDNTLKPKKTSPLRMKSKPEIQVNDKSSKQPTSTVRNQSSSPKNTQTKFPTSKPKSAIALNTSTDDDDVIIDVQQAKSSRENSPDRRSICPTPVGFLDDVGTPRFPDEVNEPDDEFLSRTHQTIHETESIVDDIVEICEDDELFVKRTTDDFRETDESLLSVNDKVSKFNSKINNVNKTKDTTSKFKETERKVHSDLIDDKLKSDQCLLSVSEKVNKFAKGPVSSKDRSPSRNIEEEYDKHTTYQDDYTKLSVNDKAHLFIETAENAKSSKVKAAQKIERPDLSNVDDDLKSDDCLLSVSDKVNKFVKTAEQFLNETLESEEKERKIREQHEKIMRKIVENQDDNIKSVSLDSDDDTPDTKTNTNARQSSFAKDTSSSHAKIRDVASTNDKPNEKAPTVKITTLRSSEAVKKAKALFENIASTTTPQTKELPQSKTPKTHDTLAKKNSKPTLENTQQPRFDNDVSKSEDVKRTTSVPEKRPVNETTFETQEPRIKHKEKPEDSAPYLRPVSSNRARSPSYKTKEISSTTITTTTNNLPNQERPGHEKSDKPQDKVPGYQRPTKTSQLKEETKITEEIDVSSRRGSGKFGVELRRTSIERSTASTDRRRSSVEHHQPCIEDIFDLELLEQMLEKVVGYEQRRRIRAQIRVARKNEESEHITTSTVTRNKQTKTTKTRSPERHSQRESPERPVKTESQKPHSPERQPKHITPQTVPVDHVGKQSPQIRMTTAHSHLKDTEKPVLNGHAKEPSENPGKDTRARSPTKLAPKVPTKSKSPLRQSSPEKKTRPASPTKTATPKPKSNRFSEYASAYMKKVGLNETDKNLAIDVKVKKTPVIDQQKSKTIESHHVETKFSKITSKNITERTSSKDTIETVHVNGKRSPSPQRIVPESQVLSRKVENKAESPDRKPHIPDTKTYSSDRKAHSPERKTHITERKPHSPQRKPHSPERKPHSPERKPHSTERKPHSTERKQHSTERKPHSTERKPQSPERKPHSPERKAHSPDRNIQSPDLRTQSPAGTRNVDRQTQKSPDRLQNELNLQKSDTTKTKKETIIKTVYEIEKKIPQKQKQEEKPSWVTNRNLKKITSETRTFSSKKVEPEKPKYRSTSPSKVISKPLDVITSSYGPGPLDSDGKPLFGIKALRNGASNYQVKGTVIREEFHSRNGSEPEGTVSVTAYSTEPADLEKLLQSQNIQEKPSRILHGLAAITTTKKFGGDTGTTLSAVNNKEERAALDQFTHSDRRVIESRITSGTNSVDRREQKYSQKENIYSTDAEDRHAKDKTERIVDVTENLNDRLHTNDFEKRTLKEKKTDTKDKGKRVEEKIEIREMETVGRRANEKSERTERKVDERKTVRQSSVKSLTEKYIKSASETSKSERTTYPKAGLILRTSTMKDSISSDSAGLARTDSEHSLGSEEEVVTTTTEQLNDGVRTTTTTTTRSGHGRQERSFLDSSTKVTGVQDILTRMKNADIVIEEGDSSADTEARALLNKFLGATVLMAGMQNYVTEKPTGKVVIKQVQETVSSSCGKTSSSRRAELFDVDQCWDERVLRTLLDECSDYEQRRRLRARLRTLMAEQEACASAVTEALAAAGEGGETDEQAAEREEEEVTTVTSSVRRNSTEKTVSTSTTVKNSKVIESMTRPAPKPVSPFAKFRQLEKQNSTNSPKM